MAHIDFHYFPYGSQQRRLSNNTKGVGGAINCLVTDILQNILFGQQKKETHPGLEQLVNKTVFISR